MSNGASDLFIAEEDDRVTLGDIKELQDRLLSLWRLIGWRAIVARCIELSAYQCSLRSIEQPLEYLRSHPWVGHRIAQWVLADKECPQIGRVALTDARWRELLKLAYDFGDGLAMRYLIQNQSVSAFRSMAYQQFIYQSVETNGLLRQSLLLAGLPSNHRINRYLELTYDLTVQEIVYLGYCFAAAATNSQNGSFNLGNAAQGWFPRNKVIAYSNRISATLDELKANAPNSRQITLETALQHPIFSRTPLARIAGRLQAWAPNFVVHAAKSFVENALKDSGDADLVSQYGALFESYVRTALGTLSLRVFGEKELRATLIDPQKLIDFIIETDKNLILVESKYKSDDPKAQVDRSLERVGDRYSSSFIKAIEQAHTTADAIRSNMFDRLFSHEGKNIFCIIVTSAQHYMGSGEQLDAQTGNKRIEQATSATDFQDLLPLSNIILLSADGLDMLACNIQLGAASIDDFVIAMKASRADPKSHVLVAEQLISVPQANSMPIYLRDEMHGIDEYLQRRYPPYSRQKGS